MVSPLRICLVGGTGTISAAVVAEAVRQGHEVTVVNRGRTTDRPLPPGVETLVADARDESSLASVLGERTFDAIADFVAFVPRHVELDLRVLAPRTPQYVFISSASAYHKPVQSPVPITEQTPLANPLWAYSRDKIACEELLAEAIAEGAGITIVRPSHTYDETAVPMGHWTFVERMRAGQPVFVPGDGTTFWTLTHARDLAAAFVGLLGNSDALGRAIHITSDEALVWNDIYAELARAAGVEEPELVHVPADLMARADADLGDSVAGDKAHNLVFDNTLVKSLVPGWAARTSWVDGAREIVAWHDADPVRRGRDEKWDRLNDQLCAFMQRPL